MRHFKNGLASGYQAAAGALAHNRAWRGKTSGKVAVGGGGISQHGLVRWLLGEGRECESQKIKKGGGAA